MRDFFQFAGKNSWRYWRQVDSEDECLLENVLFTLKIEGSGVEEGGMENWVLKFSFLCSTIKSVGAKKAMG